MVSKSVKIFTIGFRQVLRDGMLLILIPAPFLMAAALRILVPLIDGYLQQQMDIAITPWYGVSDGLLITMTPVMTAMISAFLILEERDEGIGIYYNITPATGYSYLVARLGLPMIWGFFSSILVILLFAFTDFSMLHIIVSAKIATLQGIIMGMFLVTIAGNKVEGLALAKLSNIFVMSFIVPWVLSTPARFIFGVFPGFWIGEIYRNPRMEIVEVLIRGFGGIISSIFFMILLMRLFLRRIT